MPAGCLAAIKLPILAAHLVACAEARAYQSDVTMDGTWLRNGQVSSVVNVTISGRVH